MTGRSADLGLMIMVMVITLSVVGGLLLAGVFDVRVLRLASAAALVLVLPGLALTAALVPKSSVAGLVRLMLSMSVSIAVAIAGGFMLNWTRVGLRATPWVALLTMITLTGGVTAYWRGLLVAPVDRRFRWHLQARHVLCFCAAVLLAGVAVRIARTAALTPPSNGFAQLWILSGDRGTARVGIGNYDGSVQTFRLELATSDHVFRRWGAIVIEPGKQWDAVIDVPDRQTVVARLYRRADSAPYRQVWLPR